MGFFRFRRSIKLFPGVRWNIGKKSSSLSFGVRGLHYTVGTHGTRTTVGLPGTGLSYTSTGTAHRSPQPNHDMDQAKREETVHFQIPDREPDEKPATEGQIDAIGNLVSDIDLDQLANLGERQAAVLIDKIKTEKQRYTGSNVQEYQTMQNQNPGFVATLFHAIKMVLIGVLILFLALLILGAIANR